jgi:hypothetical protein
MIYTWSTELQLRILAFQTHQRFPTLNSTIAYISSFPSSFDTNRIRHRRSQGFLLYAAGGDSAVLPHISVDLKLRRKLFAKTFCEMSSMLWDDCSPLWTGNKRVELRRPIIISTERRSTMTFTEMLTKRFFLSEPDGPPAHHN